MEITDIRIRKIESEGKLRGVASFNIGDEFVIHDIKIIEGDRGLFIAMPSRKAADGGYKDIAHPISTKVREELQAKILEAYENA
ncbi:MAG: septation regulator SpoVG [Lachnospiraceae bacterium]|jgi:stage V sporulation protein G|nr:septation regulator SpoVG [Lachnospiraceae bacterium]MBQ3968811.1 septation regulator SpoVG [Lachnospiraceae bacterium]MBR4587749.1 septation regulator SpoVG [Lachnospiraceae bacterium]MCR4927874.1 septation regulator SpoVG [Lachnospiraceae bacterium]